MAVTFTWTDAQQGKQNFGSLFVRIGTLNLTGTASAGGDVFTAAMLGLSRIIHANAAGATPEGFVPITSISGKDCNLKLFYAPTTTPGALVVATGVTVTGTLGIVVFGI